VVEEVDVSRSRLVRANKLLVARRSCSRKPLASKSRQHLLNIIHQKQLTLRLGVTRQHTLDANTHTLHIVHRTPALRVQQIQAYDPVAVDVGVHRNGAVGGGEEDYFGRFDRVGGGEGELEAVLVGRRVEGVVEDRDVHLPFFEVGRGDEGYAGGEGALDLWEVGWLVL
jgi:hypothetical protein